jgi:hypothetical protein
MRRCVAQKSPCSFRVSPADADYMENLASLFRASCRRVEEMALDSYSGWSRFHTIMTSDLLGFLIDLGTAGAGLLVGLSLPTPGASLLPPAIGELARRRVVAKALATGGVATNTAWYTECLDWQHRITYDRKSGCGDS